MKGKDKILQTLNLPNEPLLGISDRCTSQISVNIELIWERCKGNENKFIKLFSKTYTHETLHMLIDGIVEDLLAYGEEKVIRTMLKEKWNKELRKYYHKNKKEKIKKIKKLIFQ